MSWRGYNFEDSILVSEKLIKEDVFTSIHIEEFECVARDTKLGKEAITRDIPNVTEEVLRNLDEIGIVRIGAEVQTGDILVGKVTPKGETQLSPEEKLLRAIFGEKAGDVRDTSLRVSPGIKGTVINVRVFSREGMEKDTRAKEIEDQEIQKILQDQEDEIKIIRDSAYEKIIKLLLEQKTASKLVDEDTGKTLIDKNVTLTHEILSNIPKSRFTDISIKNGEKIEKEINTILINMNEQVDLVKMIFNDRIDKLRRGDELPPGVINVVKVSVCYKRRLSVGDKMAGRHGNKGVVSIILPVEDMPFLPDGTPIDIVLNPLGVPSRMNVGQILETHLGWASQTLGHRLEKIIETKASPETLRKTIKKYMDSKEVSKLVDQANDSEIKKYANHLAKNGFPVISSVFDGARENDIVDILNLAELPDKGQIQLKDGRTGEPFDKEITIGTIYMLKLHHLVEDKIHARSIGPYSLVTQQPLGGKAQFGGQRLGEMEVWALEAYGAAHSLQEFLTVKSDDIAGRNKVYEAIVKGETDIDIGIPESFNVLIKELQGLALNVELREKGE
jgi:DNA-directed RNA polymerase subunit beta